MEAWSEPCPAPVLFAVTISKLLFSVIIAELPSPGFLPDTGASCPTGCAHHTQHLCALNLALGKGEATICSCTSSWVTPLHGKSHGDFRPVFYSPGVAFCTVPFRTEPSSHRQEGESISKLLPVTSTCQGTTNSYFHSHIGWVKSIPFKITALTFEPFRQTASGSTLFFCWKKRKKDPWHVINRARLISKSEWHPLLNNELQIFCYKS